MMPTVVMTTVFIMLVFRLLASFADNRGVVTDGDAVNHLTFVKEFYRGAGELTGLSGRFVLDGGDYPTGFHKFFYYLKIPVPVLERHGRYVPIVCDLFLLGLAAWAVSLFGGPYSQWLYAFPFLRLFIGHQGRAHHFNERAFGVLFGNLYLFAAVAFWTSGHFWWLALALPAFAVFSVSSKFAWQATAFISALLACLTGSVSFIVLYAVSMLVASILSRGYAIQVLSGLIRHSTFYKTHLAPRYPQLRQNYRECFQYKTFKLYIHKLATNSALSIVTDNPLQIVLAFALLTGGPFDIWAKWALCGIVLVLLIATEGLKFLGEPERYLEFTVLPVFVYLSRVPAASVPVSLAAVIALMAIIFFLNYYWQTRTHRVSRQKQDDMLALRRYLAGFTGRTILTIPFRLSFFLGYENMDNRYVTLFANVGKGEKGQYYRWLLKDRYPFVRDDLDAVTSKHDVDFIVVEDEQVKFMNGLQPDGYYRLDKYLVLYANNHYRVLAAC